MNNPITVEQFRKNFPAFADPAKFHETAVQFWLDYCYGTTSAANANGAVLLNAQRWGAMLDLGAQLFTAHNLVLEAEAGAAVKVNGVPGEYVGAVQSESVDKVSVNYDTSTTLEEGAGHWNLTTYGKRFYRFSQMAGAGGLQLGIGCAPPFSGVAWPGPLVLQVPNPDG